MIQGVMHIHSLEPLGDSFRGFCMSNMYSIAINHNFQEINAGL